MSSWMTPCRRQSTMQDDQRCSGWGKNWLKNMKDWTGYPVQDLVTITQNRHEWKAFSAAMLPTVTCTSQRTNDWQSTVSKTEGMPV